MKKYAEGHEKRLHQHVNVEVMQFLDNARLVKKLKKFECKWVKLRLCYRLVN